jgi:GNAT superfamily N-acetyltransferase
MRNRFVKELMTKPVTIAETKQWMNDDVGEIICMIEDGSLVGGVIIYEFTEAIAIFCEPGKGCGSRLLEYAERWAKEDGHDTLMAKVQPDNERSVRFFLKHGYALWMRKHL